MNFSKRMEAEKLQRYLKKSTQMLLESMHHIMVVDVHNFEIVRINRAFLNEFRLKEKDVLGDKCYHIIHHQHRPCSLGGGCPLLKAKKTGKSALTEYVCYCKGNKKMYITVTALPIKDQKGNVAYVVLVLTDATRRRRAEEALQEIEEKHRIFTEGTRDIIYILSRDGYIQYVNNFAARQARLKPEDIIGKKIDDFAPPSLVSKHRRYFQKIYKTGKPVYSEDRITLLNRRVWLGTWLVPVKDRAGNVIAITGTSRDITGYKKQEEQLKNMLEDLRKRERD